MIKLRMIFLSSVLLALFFSARVVLADTGPKPTMEFSFQQELPGGPVTITSGTLYECQQQNCSDAAPLQEGGPQRFTCDEQSCNALAYGFAPYHKLEIKFSDGKTRQSNIFPTDGFNSKYTVTIRPDDLLVEARPNMFPRMVTVILLCLCLLVVGAVVIGLIVFFLRRRSKG